MKINSKLENYQLILASKSPRRQSLLRDLGLSFEIKTKEVEEIYPDTIKGAQVAEFLSELKAAAFKDSILTNELIITSDTIVRIGDEILGKPKSTDDAKQMLNKLSGTSHIVTTGVCLFSKDKQHTFSENTQVFFKELTQDEIDYYVKQFSPLDKAGSYGIQEWIGYIGVQKIEGCYFNVMGLPLARLYQELLSY